MPSVRAQTLPGVQHVVLGDDCALLARENVRRGLERESPGTAVRNLRSTRPESYRPARTALVRNAGISQANGRFVAHLDDDNAFEPEHLATLVGTTRFRGAEFILRSKSPVLVRQEIFALLTVYQALCSFRAEAAHQGGIDPDRVSFTVTMRVARTEVSNQAAATPTTLEQARTLAIGDLLADLLPARRARQYERIRKAPKSNYTIKKHDHARVASHVKYKIKVTRKADLAARTP